jgi:hypothetical protein
MAAPQTKVYGNAQKHLDVDVDFAADTIKCTLHTSTYSPNQATHEFASSLTNELSTANGYTVGGATLGTKSVTVTSLTTAYKAAATSWTASGSITARYAVVWKDTGSAATSPLLAYVLLDSAPADVTATNAAFTITWDSTDGVFKAVAS